jgi:hypothetical protein
MKKLAIIIVTAITALSGVAPAQAFPTMGVSRVETSQPVEKVQYRGDMWRNGGHGYRERHRRYYRDGYRGRHYSRYDRRYRHHHGSNAGAIIGGLAAGAIIGGALAQPRYAPPPRRYVSGSSHTQWCYNRYRSYRAYDNTFQPYNGPRTQCYSPYR